MFTMRLTPGASPARHASWLVLAIALAASGSANATTIDTGTGWNGTQGACCLGDGDIVAAAEFVQTFTLQPGDDPYLDTIVFQLQHYSGSDALDFTVSLYLWGGGGVSGLIGAPLFSTGTLSSASVASPSWESVEIVVGGLELVIGQAYAIRIGSVVDAVAGLERVASVGTNPYPYGDAWFQSSPGFWRSDLIPGDLVTTINTVPEPATLPMLAGLLLLLAVRAPARE